MIIWMLDIASKNIIYSLNHGPRECQTWDISQIYPKQPRLRPHQRQENGYSHLQSTSKGLVRWRAHIEDDSLQKFDWNWNRIGDTLPLKHRNHSQAAPREPSQHQQALPGIRHWKTDRSPYLYFGLPAVEGRHLQGHHPWEYLLRARKL